MRPTSGTDDRPPEDRGQMGRRRCRRRWRRPSDRSGRGHGWRGDMGSIAGPAPGRVKGVLPRARAAEADAHDDAHGDSVGGEEDRGVGDERGAGVSDPGRDRCADGLGSAQRLREHISVGEAGAASVSERQALHVPVAVRSRSCLRHHPRCPLGLDVDEAGGGERAASRSARTTRPGASAGMASRRRRMSSARQPAAVSGTTSPGTSARIPRAAGWCSTASTAGSSPEGDALPRTPDGGLAGPVVSGGGAGGAGSAAPQPAAAVERVLVRP